MIDFFIRSEDIQDEEFPNFFVETPFDRDVVDKLKGKGPTVLVGSRGVGKSFLMHMAESEMLKEQKQNKSLPVYITLTKSSLVSVNQKGAFHSWMMAKICSATLRRLRKYGYIVKPIPDLDLLSGGKYDQSSPLKIEEILSQYEESWKKEESIDSGVVPSVDDFKSAIADICESCGLKRLVFFFDEAAHVFIREQQAAFFTLFRDLRCPQITCHAAIYPGVTAFGEVFQPKEDATFIHVSRNVFAPDYVDYMRQMIEKQEPDSSLLREISRKGEYFANLAFAANGNPRHLLNTVSKATKFNGATINQVIKDFYKTDMLGEHSELSIRYPSLDELIVWGRNFVEDIIVPELSKRNSDAISSSPKKSTSCFFWIHQNAPQSVLRAISLLEYTGIVQEHTRSIKATRAEVGTRYMVNLGLLFAAEANPMSIAHEIVSSLDIKLMKEFGENSESFNAIKESLHVVNENDVSASVKLILEKDINVLNLSAKMKEKLLSLSLNKIRDVINSTESKLMEAHYIGRKRSRYVKNVAVNAIYEYLLG